MRYTAAKQALRQIGMRLTRNTDGEYRVAYGSDREATAYYTDDLGDAVATGRLMAVKANDTINAYIAGLRALTPAQRS